MVLLMGKKSHGLFKGSRKLKKKVREKGLYPLSRIMYEYKDNEKVLIKIDSSVHKGRPHPRFHGRIGEVIGRRGRAYIIKMKDIKKTKYLIVTPEHLRPFNPASKQ